MDQANSKYVPQVGPGNGESHPSFSDGGRLTYYGGGGSGFGGRQDADRREQRHGNEILTFENASGLDTDDLDLEEDSAQCPAENSADVSSFGKGEARKRRLEVVEDSPEPLKAPKVNTARRGGRVARGTPTAYTEYAKAQARLRRKELSELDTDDGDIANSVKSTRTGPREGQPEVGLSEEDSSVGQQKKEELLGTAREGVRRILSEAGKRGAVRKAIKEASKSIMEALDSLQTCPMDDETRRLRADNIRLSHEVDLLRKDVSALRKAFSERSLRAPEQLQDQSTEMLEELKRSLTISVGEMVNARLECLEERLPPQPILRPPLAGDRRKAAQITPLVAKGGHDAKTVKVAKAAETVKAAKAPKTTEAVKMTKAGKAAKTADAVNATKAAKKAKAAVPTPAPRTGEPTPPPEGQWSKAESRKKRRKRQRQRRAAEKAAATREKTSQAPQKKTSVKLASPRTTAVVITLQPEALERGVTYAQAITRAKREVQITDLGIAGVRIRQTTTGARILQIPGASSGEKADRLAQKIQAALGEDAKVARPTRRVELRISGLDDSVTTEEVCAAVAAKAVCPTDQIKVGAISYGRDGSGAVIVRCPVTSAKLLVGQRLLVGWSSAHVKVLEPLPMRCFRCMGCGHVGTQCPGGTDRSRLCFRCGKPGHVSAGCTAEARCAVCAVSGRPATHVMGGRSCRPPPTRPKQGALASRAPPNMEVNQTPPPVMRDEVSEEVEMSDG